MLFISIILLFCEVFINIIFTFYCKFNQMFWAHHLKKKSLYHLAFLFLQADTPFLSWMWHYGSKDKSPAWLWGEGQEVGTQEGKGRREPSLQGNNLTGHTGGGETGGMVFGKLPTKDEGLCREETEISFWATKQTFIWSHFLLFDFLLVFPSHFSKEGILFCFWCSHSTSMLDSAAFQHFCISASVWMNKCIHS